MSILVFDIETIPDVDAGRKLHDLANLSDEDTAAALFALRRAKVGNDFLPHYLQKVVAISLVLSQGATLKVWSLGDEHSDEKDLIQRFFSGIDKYTPTLISWNGSGFDLPVLHYRALLHGISAPTYWETGDNQQAFRWNNYLNRFHYRHLDLMDTLAAYQNKAFAPLDQIATMLGFPGKMGMSGAKVWEQFCAGNLKSIRDYCETDVLNTYCVYLRFELMRGTLDPSDYEKSLQRLKDYLHSEDDKLHLQEFLAKMN
ncbi:putative 3'-5' exonuclease related to the exonuclease domain of PolB [Legionella massiliensis]|uniref:Putative 3'-5' exonuclease related to the exonuclease domain of PolB n=1 Tax=Legionella massiliensis TaxID=1034943 RepID=A0A078KXL4_9GAMM|nr:3'-5' exonuclease [Legionella massiliensis]CDZ79150.1 putative 3'-5' exonuclease related to the exonuclease domain of PolB [Legionella massiliensis]CEE14888.1 putative 3'-5' exonuclease related to the exonuclease domain of PolB [Legionella massiliensis]